MVRRTIICAVLVFFIFSTYACVKPHYTFVLPENYIGWIQVIFGDPGALPLPIRKDAGREILVPETGIFRTSDIRVLDARSHDEFYYTCAGGECNFRPLPSEYVMPGTYHGGFGVSDTGGNGRGDSWFLFVGPPELRAKVPLADYSKVVEEYRKTHGGKAYNTDHITYPTPGRMTTAQN
jgi:hypothetical protein